MEYPDVIEYREQDKHLCVVSAYTESDAPKLHRMFWSFGRCHAEDIELYVGKEIRSLGDGRYSVRIAPYQWVNLALPEGGRTKCDHVEITPIECPKVRKGIETRYYNGTWQKYNKREGWVSA